MTEDCGMRRLCASSVIVWLWASAAQAAPPEEPTLPGIGDEVDPAPSEPAEPSEPPEPAETPTETPTEPAETPPEPSEPPPAEPPEALGPASGPVEPFEPSTPPATTTSTGTRTSPASPATPSPAATSKPTKDDGTTSDGAKKTEDDGAKQDDEKEEAEPIKHKGFIVDFRVGVLGCTRPICKRHDAKPGLRLDGMLGRNFFGIIDFGLAGAWGRMRANVAPGTDGLSLYGLDPAALPPEAAALMFDQFTVNEAHFETVQAGFDLRVHVIPRGRFDPYVGVGAQYNLLRAIYDTPAGATRLGFHGLAFPIQAGMVVFVHKNIALGAQFDWLVTWYGGITVRGAPGRLGAPIPLIKDAAAQAGVNLPGDLPHFWSLGAVVHLRLGK